MFSSAVHAITKWFKIMLECKIVSNKKQKQTKRPTACLFTLRLLTAKSLYNDVHLIQVYISIHTSLGKCELFGAKCDIKKSTMGLIHQSLIKSCINTCISQTKLKFPLEKSYFD